MAHAERTRLAVTGPLAAPLPTRAVLPVAPGMALLAMVVAGTAAVAAEAAAMTPAVVAGAAVDTRRRKLASAAGASSSPGRPSGSARWECFYWA